MSDPVFYGKPLTFNPRNHRYTWDGQHVPSVTTILWRLDKPALIQWAADCAVEHIRKTPDFTKIDWEAARKAHATIRDEAGDVGTIVHKYARAVLEAKGDRQALDGLTLPLDVAGTQALKAIAAFEAWMQTHKIEPVAVERRVFSQRFMYAGTLDFTGRIDDELSLLDFKTGNDVYDEAWFQMGGYDDALTEEHEWQDIFGDSDTPRLAHWIIHLDKNTGEFAAYRRGPEETLAARKVWRALVGLDKCIREMPKMPRTKRAA
jgi:hypothetical protein